MKTVVMESILKYHMNLGMVFYVFYVLCLFDQNTVRTAMLSIVICFKM